MVSLILPQEQQMAVAVYHAQELVPTLIPPRLSGRDPSVPYVAGLCGLIGVLCGLRNCRKKEVRSVPQIEMAYELGEETLIYHIILVEVTMNRGNKYEYRIS